jgi:hypothetical protein
VFVQRSKTNRFLSVKHNCLASFKHSYMFRLLTITIQQPVQVNDLYCSAKTYSCDQIKKNVMGGACGLYGGGEWSLQGFGDGTCRKETTWMT